LDVVVVIVPSLNLKVNTPARAFAGRVGEPAINAVGVK
jgi:hypothetical protein